MNTSDVVQIVSSLGFPIVMCGAMAYYVKYITDKNREQINDMNAKHQNEMQEVTLAINNNTIALTKLCEKLEEGK